MGKERLAEHDTAETAFAKQVWGLAGQFREHLVSVTTDDFEVVAAAAVQLSGAHEMRALCTGDEGGIDFYGRLMVRPPEGTVEPGILYTTILPKRVLILGQAKRYMMGQRIGRPEIQTFKGQVEECLEKYAGNARPPSHRVPASYYERGEPCLGVFMTTAAFAETAEGSAFASGIILVDGIQLAQFLVHHRVGLRCDGGRYMFDGEVFEGWLEGRRRDLAPHT